MPEANVRFRHFCDSWLDPRVVCFRVDCRQSHALAARPRLTRPGHQRWCVPARWRACVLLSALSEPETCRQAAEALRGLIEEIRITPEGEGNTVELANELAALLRLGGTKNAASIEEAARSGLLVAGACKPTRP